VNRAGSRRRRSAARAIAPAGSSNCATTAPCIGARASASEAVGGRALVERSYAAAVALRYRWHEFGDSHLLLP